MFHVIIPSDVSRTLGTLLDREAVIAVLFKLRDELENNGAIHRKARHPDEPDLYFRYLLKVFDGKRWCKLWFTVDDIQAQGQFVVVAVDQM